LDIVGDERSDDAVGRARGSSESSFIPALRFRWLTRAYDVVVPLTTRERTVKRALLDAANLGRASRLLDIGCGTGTFVIAAKQRFPHLEVVGVDPDAAILARARAKARRAHVDITFVDGSATMLPTSDDAFDRVTSSLVFHHLTSDQKRLAAGEVGRVLSADGEFHMADWVRPANLLMGVLFWSVRLLDGMETTRDHAAGNLADVVANGGLADVVQHRTLATPVGTIGLISARPRGAVPRV
jgi:ubiquinone/menaquinone biosynthesis C-methylase UbiE